ncbi:hypothetical protein HK105_201262 [Polyrhizophydium stewartii]|uniref:Uncharacterized protein n=1 Tax=Polyrhizophydium stewartii TaxID=2732419 RepID=A0ABR4NHK0_9FUNG
MTQVSPSPNKRILVEVRLKDDSNPLESARLNPVRLGWTSFDIFNEVGQLAIGRWKLELFTPPIDFNVTTSSLHEIRTPLKGASLYMRICDAAHISAAALEASGPAHEANYRPRRYLPSATQYANSDPKAAPSLVMDGKRVPAQPSPLGVTRTAQEIIRAFLTVVPIDNFREHSGPTAEELRRAAAAAAEMRELLAKAQTFDLGIQLEEIKIPDAVGLQSPSVRMHIIDASGDPETFIGFVSTPAERGYDETAFGWEHGLHHELRSVPAIAGRRAIFEVLDDDGQAMAYSELQIFKFHNNKPFDINDGLHRLALLHVAGPKKQAENSQDMLFVRIYKPKHGLPPPKRFVPKLITPPIPREAWIEVPQSLGAKYKREAFTIVIDGARYLPENVSATRVIARILTGRSKPVPKCPEMITNIDLDSPFSQKIEGDAHDVTSVVVFRVITIDRALRRKRLVGTAVLNIFVDPTTKEQPESRVPLDAVCINEGSFQIPIYATSIESGAPISLSVLDATPRVPCASLLVRLLPWKQGQEPEIVEQKYNEAIYQSVSRCRPTAYEERLFHFVHAERRAFTTRDRLLALGGLPKQALQGDDGLLSWASKILGLKFADELDTMDYAFICQYDRSYGFRLCVDAALNIAAKGYSVVAISMFPPAALYRGSARSKINPAAGPSMGTARASRIPTASRTSRMLSDSVQESSRDAEPASSSRGAQGASQQMFYDDIVFTKRMDPASTLRNATWKDGWYRQRPASRVAAAFIHVFTVVQQDGKPKRQSQGWTLLPIFRVGAVDMGCFQLPLYEREPPESLLQKLDKALELESDGAQQATGNDLEHDHDQDTAESILANALADGEITVSRRWSSIVVRLSDARRSDELPLDLASANTDRLGPNAARFQPSGSSQTIASIVPRRMTTDEFVELMILAATDEDPEEKPLRAKP